jgi:tetratricopeptide (TPR) repeat protein
MVLSQQGKFDESVKHLTAALQIDNDQPDVHSSLGYVLARQGKFDKAIEHLTEALQLNPNLADAHNYLGYVLTQQGKLDEAIPCFTVAIQLDPTLTDARHYLALALVKKGKLDEAILHLREVLRIKPDSVASMNALAWLLATHTETKFYNPQQAVQLALRACELTKYSDPGVLDTLAASYAAAGKFPEAVSAAEKALNLAESLQLKTVAEEVRNRLRLYNASKPYIEPPPK